MNHPHAKYRGNQECDFGPASVRRLLDMETQVSAVEPDLWELRNGSCKWSSEIWWQCRLSASRWCSHFSCAGFGLTVAIVPPTGSNNLVF